MHTEGPATKADLEQLRLATQADLEKLSARLDARIERLEVKLESLDKRLVVIQWIGVIFLAVNGALIAFNGALIGVLLWTLAKVVVR
jgi:hypothetical protein